MTESPLMLLWDRKTSAPNEARRLWNLKAGDATRRGFDYADHVSDQATRTTIALLYANVTRERQIPSEAVINLNSLSCRGLDAAPKGRLDENVVSKLLTMIQ